MTYFGVRADRGRQNQSIRNNQGYSQSQTNFLEEGMGPVGEEESSKKAKGDKTSPLTSTF
jgi:hypothetical protein